MNKLNKSEPIKNKLVSLSIILLLIVSLSLLLLLSGCTKTIIVQAPSKDTTNSKYLQSQTASEDESPQQNPKTQTNTKPDTKSESQKTENTVQQTALAIQPSEKIKKLLNKHIGRVKSMSYLLQDPTTYPAKWIFFVKDNKIHIKLDDLKNVQGDTYIDNVYLDTSSKTAIGFCEAKLYRCKDPNKEIETDYSLYFRKTPLDWIKQVTYAKEVGSETRQNRNTIIIEYPDQDSKIMMWVDEFYGTPLEVRVIKGSSTKKYLFEDLAINSVTDAKLDHPQILITYNPN